MGIYADYIGAQVNQYGHAMDVKGQNAVVDQPVISYRSR
jgi:hypothetical protein